MSRTAFEVKTNEQIILMRQAGLATAAALAAVKKAIRPGVTTAQLDAIAEQTIIAKGGHSNFKLVPGYFHTICASVNDEVVHGIPGDRILQPGDLVSIDCGAEIGDWNGDSAISVIVPDGDGFPPADPELVARRQKLSDVTEESLWVGIAALAKAEYLNEVGAAIERFVRESGKYGILEDYVGHGIGRSMHEDPPVYNYATKFKGPKVVPGLCVAIEPMLTDGSPKVKILSDGWTVAAKDQSNASHWEHSIAVHDRGIWVLTEPDGGVAKLAKFGVVPVALA